MHCRMCSQRLPRPGRLCRECEQELDFARSARPGAGLALASQPDPLLLTEANERVRVPPRPVVVAAAFAVGLSAAAAIYAIHASWSTGKRESVMVDRPVDAGRGRLPPRPARESVVGIETPAIVPVTASAPGAQEPPNGRIAVASPPTRRPFDRVLGLADALDTCAREPVFARIACESKARARYCDGAAASIPQCAEAASRE